MHEEALSCNLKEKSPIFLTRDSIESYLNRKLEQGVSPVAVAKYRVPLYRLHDWLGEDKELSALRLQIWRKDLEAHGYSKNTVQTHVQITNDFLRTVGRKELCIPKPLRVDLTGRTYGYLTVLEPTDKRQHKELVWRCQCRCGKEVEATTAVLTGGNTTSCGCLRPEILQHANRYEENTELRQAMSEVIRNPNSQSGFVGVHPRDGKWTAYITYKKRRYRLGTYSNLEDAVKARARAKEAVMKDAARIYEETEHLYENPPGRLPKPKKTPPVESEPVVIRARRSNNTSGHAGVTRQYNKWSASICVKGVCYRLGAYDELEDAVAVRQRAEALVKKGDLETLRKICTNRKR